MCGIAGALWFDPKAAVELNVLERMTDSLVHRGPDDRGIYRSDWQRDVVGVVPGVALGFRRLSIIDLAGGHQPMSNEDGSIQIVFNGEIYNYKDLRRRLEGTGHRFSSQSDTETIIHLYEDLGTECFEYLNGMFALAIWDRRQRQLVLARDRLGKKPLYYQWRDRQLLFGSELKALAEAPSFDCRISPGSIDAYLTYQYVPHPESIYRSVRKLPPGHFAVFRQREETESWVQRYWNFDASVELPLTADQAAVQTRDLLEDSVRLRLRSDVPLGTFLSGGIDSSLIVALAQQKLDQPLHTFSIGFKESEFDETPYARLVAQWVGTQHHEHLVTPDAVSILDQLVTHYDEPFGDSSALPTWYLCQWTRQHVKVALTGDGGDELFAGYDRYRALWLSQWINRIAPIHGLLDNPLIRRLPASNRRRSFIRRLQRFGEALNQSPSRRFMNWLQIFPEQMRIDLYREEFIQQLPDEDPFEFFDSAWRKVGQRDLVSQASLADLVTYLPCDLMNKVDIASMAHSLECRQPMMDYRLVELAARIPSRHKFGIGSSKKVLRRAFDRQLPRQIWTRKKMGFGIPIDAWFRSTLRPITEQRLLDADARCHQYFRPEAIGSLIQQHSSGKVNHGYRLWCLLILESWLRRWQQ
jgi:asparagine synthase (glutamine-hydrolysing)